MLHRHFRTAKWRSCGLQELTQSHTHMAQRRMRSSSNNKTPARFGFPRWNLSKHPRREHRVPRQREGPGGPVGWGPAFT